MDLGLAKTGNLIGEIEHLEQEDLDQLEFEASVMPANDARAARAKHHRIAQLVAIGRKQTEIAQICGCTQPTISTLMQSPAFMALVEGYRKEVFDRDVVMFEKMSDVADEGLQALQQEIVTGALNGDDLRKCVMDLFDRTGRGPSRTVNKNVRVGLTVDELEEIKKAAPAVLDAEFRRE